MKRLLSGFLLLTVTTGVFAQEATPANRHTTHAMMFGTGRSNIYDTYLSPSTYRGPHLNFMRETLRPTHWADGRVSVQTLLDGYLAYTKTNTASSHELSGMINYTAGWHYNWQLFMVLWVPSITCATRITPYRLRLRFTCQPRAWSFIRFISANNLSRHVIN